MLDEAIAVYDKTLSLDPDHLDTLSNKALALDLGRNDEAIAVYDKVLSIIPNDLAALNS